jgi:hypothetical protein
MHLTGLDLFFWVASLLGHLTLLAVLWLRKRVAEFPLFTSLITMYVGRTIVLFFVYRFGSKDAYFYTYWSLAIVDVALQFGVFYEIASKVFRPAGSWASDLRWSFVWLLSLSAIVGIGLTWLAAPATKTLHQAIAIRGNFFSSVLMSELFVGITVLSVTMGLPWKTHVARIAQGLGTYSIVGFGIEGLQSYFGVAQGTEAYSMLSHVSIAVYLVCVAYWIITLAQEAPVSSGMPIQMERQMLLLQRRTAFQLAHLRGWGRQ